MKRLYKILGLLCLVLLPIIGKAQETMTVGGAWVNESGTLQACPIGFFYRNSISQVIYTREELSELSGNMITALTYTLSEKATKNFSVVDIYIGEIESEAFTEQKFISTTGMEKVATINLGTFDSKTLQLPLDNPYMYDGGSNLIVSIIRKNDPIYENRIFESFDNGTSGDEVKNQCIYANTDQSELEAEDISDIDFHRISDSKKGYGKIRPITTFTYEIRSEEAVLKLSHRELAFGWQRAGQTGAQMAFKVVNPGAKTLTIGSVTIPEGLGTITPDPAGVTVATDGEKEFTFTLSGTQGTYSGDVVFNAPGADPAANTATMHVSGMVYPQTALLESFEGSGILPPLFRNRTGGCSVRENGGPDVAHYGERCVGFGSSADTLVFPKMRGTVYMHLKADIGEPAVSILQSSDLRTWSEVEWDKPTLTTTYQEVKIDLTSQEASFLAVAGKAFSLDHILIPDPVIPAHDLNFVSWTTPDVLNERSEAEFTVTVSNWGTSEETVVLELIDQENRVLATKNGGALAAKESKEYTMAWTPGEGDRNISSLQCRIVLAGDEDATNQTSPVKPAKVVPYLPVAVFSPASLFFDALPLNVGSATLDLKISNTGIAPLNVSGIAVPAPFSLDVEAPFTVKAKADTTVKVRMERKDFAGVYAGKVVVSYEGGTHEVSVAGLVRTRSSLCESFESDEWLPLGWSRGAADKGWKRAQYGAQNGSYYAECGSEADTLVTPRLNVKNGDRLLFWAQRGSELAVLYSADLKTWKELGRYRDLGFGWKGFCVEFPEGGELYVAFAGSGSPWVDYVQGPERVVAERDLRVVGVPVCPAAGNKYADVEYGVYVQNLGSLPAVDYTVQLLQGDKVLASQPGVAVEHMDTATVRVVYLPMEEGLLEDLRFRVVYAGDADESNNGSAPFSLLVRPEFYGEIVVGQTEDVYTNTTTGFWKSFYKYSLSEFLYPEARLGIRKGSEIKTLSYAVTLQDNEAVVPLRVWMGTREGGRQVSSGWTDPDGLTLVYDAESTVSRTERGEFKWNDVVLNEPYVYDGGDLVIMVEHKGNDKKNYFLKNTAAQDIHRSYAKDRPEEACTVEAALKENASPDREYPTLRFIYDMPSVIVTGKVVDEDGLPVAEAAVSLAGGGVVYRARTAGDGAFSMNIGRMGMDYVLTVEADGLFFAPETVQVAEGDMDLGTLEMTAHPVRLSVAVDGGEGLPLNGLTAVVKADGSTRTYTQKSDAETTRDTLVFENLKAGLYHATLTHPAYKDTTFDVDLERDTVLRVGIKGNDPLYVAGKVLSSVNDRPLAGADVRLHDVLYGFGYEATTGTDGTYRMAVRIAGKYVRTVTALSHRKGVDTVTVAASEQDVPLSDVTLRLDNIVVVLNVTSSQNLNGAVAVLTDNADARNTQTASISGTRFVFDNLLPAVYTLTVKRGETVLYTDDEFEVVASRDEDITIGQIAGNGTLTVKVATDNGDEATGAEIYLMNEYSGIVYDEFVGSAGVMVFEDISFGTYRFGVYKDGFLPHEELLEFVSDATIEITLKEHRIAPYALNAEAVYNTGNGKADIRMEWNNIGEYYYDGFEDHEDFAIEFEPWTLIDGDGLGTAAVRNAVYPHRGEPVAAMVFNPYSTTPASTNAAFAPLTGAKYMALFNAVGGPSDDWAIAPKRMIRKGDMLMVSFRQLMEGALPEHFTICVSTTGTDPEDFMVVSNGNYIASEARWMTFTGDMSSFAGQEVYVAIHCISDNTGDMLMIDDFFIGAVPDKMASVPAGKWLNQPKAGEFRIYLDGEFVKSVNTTSYTFADMAPGVHTVGVSQMYKGGESEITTAQVTVDDYKTVSGKWELNLSTNTNESCQDAQVSLTDKDGNRTVYTVDADNKVTVNYLRYGDYTLRVNLNGFDPVSQTISHKTASVTDIELVESIIAPANLFVSLSKSGESYLGTFTWNTKDGFNESFESYADFTQDIGDWKNIDRDGLKNFGVSNCSFPGMGEASAAIVYNPSATTPSTSNDANVRPHSGDKEVVFFSTDMGTPDDWLISPVQNIRDNCQLRFFAKSYSNVYGLESVSVLVSETDAGIGSFNPVRQINGIPVEWTEYVVDLSAYRGKNIYVAFHYTQANTFFLLLDDIYIGPATEAKAETGRAKSYNVYLDGKLSGTTTEAEYVFKSLESGRTYEAGVEAVYASGTSAKSLYSFKVENVASEKTEKAEKSVSVYPNPVRSGSEIHVDVETAQDYTIRFYNTYGRAVWETGRLNQPKQTLRLPELPAGMYFMEVQTPEGTSFGKLTVL
ncbi:MAG: choice-of-anchor J domain-containing protein [Bacteroides sp.]|nr:choice-of-anchor J domain-containing protein [Bacteroides sp.]